MSFRVGVIGGGQLARMMIEPALAMGLDIKVFAEEGAQLQGVSTLGAHERLLAETEGRGADLPLSWGARGELRNPRHVHPEVWVTLQVDAVLPLTCQRCLTQFAWLIDTDTVLVLARDESDADETEDKLDDDSIDVIVGDPQQDLLQLVEDDALLALPLSPRHDVCPGDAPAVPQDKRESPFAALKGLKN